LQLTKELLNCLRLRRKLLFASFAAELGRYAIAGVIQIEAFFESDRHCAANQAKRAAAAKIQTAM
jgi:hypothetical protein